MRFQKMETLECATGSENEGSAVPARSFQERKSCYRNLLNQVDEIEEKKDFGLQTVSDVGSILKEINVLEKEYSIEKRVDQTDETLLDCMVLSSSSSILKKCINAVDISTATYEPIEFCDKLCAQLKDEDGEFRPNDLLKLLFEARTVIPEICPYKYVYGTYNLNKVPEVKQKKIVNRDPKEKYVKKQPEKVVTLDKSEEGIDEIVKGFYNVLLEEYRRNDEQPINYYHYVIDTSDFSTTVENMFYTSFLIRDGKAKIDLEGKNPTIKPIQKKELGRFRDEGGVNSQIITAIAMEDWERHKEEGFLQKHKAMTKQNGMS